MSRIISLLKGLSIAVLVILVLVLLAGLVLGIVFGVFLGQTTGNPWLGFVGFLLVLILFPIVIARWVLGVFRRK